MFMLILFVPSLDQRTPLHKAARRAHVKIVKYLVDNAADIDVKDVKYLDVKDNDGVLVIN